jgi:ABC-type nickel/cobalt efflux system permease component RcnA
VLALQRDLVSKLTSTLKDIRTQNNPVAFLILLSISFVYGIVHSIGPGHAKTIFFSHTLSGGTPFRGIWVSSTLFAITHTGMAIIAFLLLRLVLGLSQHDIEGQTLRILKASGYMVILAGCLILLSPFLEKVLHSKARQLVAGATGLQTLAVIAGLAPCPGAFLVLVFSEIIGFFLLGILAVAAISTGMAITVGTIGTIGGTIRKGIQSVGSKAVFSLLASAVRIASALLIIAIGCIMSFGHL